jgi:GntR family transcriptional regulator / MocR family aminotransferase
MSKEWCHYDYRNAVRMKTVGRSDLPALPLDRSSDKPLNRQIHSGIVHAILQGRLKPGARLPSTRAFSSRFGVSRNTVNAAYEQLAAEGYVECVVGAGTRVVSVLPAGISGKRLRLSRRGNDLAKLSLAASRVERRAIRIGEPALDLFPSGLWKKLMAQQIDGLSFPGLGYSHAAGYAPLREQIASYLEQTRGIAVPSDRVIVVAGAQQALDLAARLLLDAGDKVLFEDPGYPGARTAILGAGANIVPVPVDGEGMNVGALLPQQRRARAAYVTPAHQFPLGATMSLSRRLSLLEWAEEMNAFILEDDYDGEFRYAGNPISALASLDRSERVVYIGTFSKVAFPSLRLGFMVVPGDFADPIAAARGFTDRHSPLLEQATLAAFMEQGHFARHVRRMRYVYAERRKALIESLEKHARDLLDIRTPETGMQVVVDLRGVNDKRAADAIGQQDLTVMPASYYLARPARGNSLVLGFANSSLLGIERSVRNIAKALRGLRTPSTTA